MILKIILFAILLGVVSIIFLINFIERIKIDNKKAIKIAKEIKKGAYTFLYEEYKVISFIILPISLFLYFYLSKNIMLAFFIGSFLSLFVGFLGMYAATKANVRTAILAKEKGEKSAFIMAFSGGGVMGFSVATVGLIGLYFFLKLGLKNLFEFEAILSAFGLGASLVAFFARVGGGIYTKSADVGADLVGKLENGMSEDDPRNPAVIADNVGDCVGDIAGMGADIYESYVASMVSAILLAYYQFNGSFILMMLPFLISSLGLISSFLGMFLMAKLNLSSRDMLRSATIFSVLFFFINSYFFIKKYELPIEFFYVMAVGCFSGLFVGSVTEYYTGGKPIKNLASISESGAATNIIYGFSIGLESTVIPVIGLSLAVWFSYLKAGHFGVALAAVSMLSTIAMTMTVDGYGPIADNAGGIAEMAGMGKDVRKITDKLDSLGNTTAAVGKGFAVGSALLSALGIFSAYSSKANLASLNLLETTVLVGLFIGTCIPFLISALTMRSVGNAALKMVMEVRRQFREIAGLVDGKAEPDYKKCIEISTKASLNEMLLPGFITFLTPIIIRYLIGLKALGGFLVGSTISGVLLSIMMANAGGAWDNAKKYIEAGNFGGKGSDAHKAAVVGDTVGDPCKDTSGPSLNILIKLMSMLSLLLVSI